MNPINPMNPEPGFGDGLDDPMLDNLESSIEEPIPAEAFAPDPMHDLLDAVEDSVEQMLPTPPDPFEEPAEDPLWEVLDKLEAETESQVIPSEASGFESPSKPVQETFGSFEDEPPVQDSEEHFKREYPLPAGLSKGSQGTGWKFTESGGASMAWCKLHNKLVVFTDCEDCDDGTGGPECEYWSDS